MNLKGINKKEIIKFIKKIYWNLDNSNKNDHSLDLSKSILSQIFNFIDPNDSLTNLKIKLNNGKINSILLDLALNREK